MYDLENLEYQHYWSHWAIQQALDTTQWITPSSAHWVIDGISSVDNPDYKT